MEHGHKISFCTLKRRFKVLDLHRRPVIPWRVNNAVSKVLDASGANLGCCRVWGSLKK